MIEERYSYDTLNEMSIIATPLLMLLIMVSLLNGDDSLRYQYSIEKDWIIMPDGIRLAVTLTIPVRRYKQEVFPSLLQYKPYRKDDQTFYGDRSNARYLARRGFIVSKTILST